MFDTAVRWSGLLLVAGALLLGAGIVLASLSPAVSQTLSPSVSLFLLLASILLLVSLPGMYASQADSAGWPGALGFALLQAGMVLLVVLSSPSVLYPSIQQWPGENGLVFFLAIALVLGLLLTGIGTVIARVWPRTAGVLLLVATAGFFFDFFISEFLPPVAVQLGSAFFGIVLGLTLAWIGILLARGRTVPASVLRL